MKAKLVKENLEYFAVITPDDPNWEKYEQFIIDHFEYAGKDHSTDSNPMDAAYLIEEVNEFIIDDLEYLDFYDGKPEEYYLLDQAYDMHAGLIEDAWYRYLDQFEKIS